MNLNGIRVTATRSADKLKTVTIFIPLPRALWRFSGDPGCTCGHCDGVGYWDTLAVCSTPSRDDRTDTTWTVHHPALHAASPEMYRLLSERAGYRMAEGRMWVKDSL